MKTRLLPFALLLACALSAAAFAADTPWIAPGQYWKLPPPLKDGKVAAPSWTLRLQPRFSFTDEDSGQPTWMVRDDNANTDDYNTRRLRLCYSRPLSEDWLAFGQVSRDWGKTDFEYSDLYLTYSGWDLADLTIGEMMSPFDRPYLESDYNLPLAERSRISTLLYTDRQIGVMLHREDCCHKRLGWQAGLYAGSGLNELKMSDGPMPVLRTEYAPCRGLSLGAAWAHRHGMKSTLFSKFLKKNQSAYGLETSYAAGDVSEDTWGLDLHWSSDGWDGWAGYTAMRADAAASSLRADGWYAHVGKMIPFRGRNDRLQLVAGYEQFDPNSAVTDQLDARWTTVGLNYHVKGNEQLWRLQYVFRDEGAQDVDNDTLLLEYDFLIKR